MSLPNLIFDFPKIAINHSINWTRLNMVYYSIYLEAFRQSLNKIKENHEQFYNDFVSELDKEFDHQLRKSHFTETLSSYMDSFVDVRAQMRKIGMPVEFFDIMSYEAKKKVLDSAVLMLEKNKYETPSEVVYRRGKIRLLHYLNENKNSIPIMLVYAQINHFDLMDINYEKSVVRNLTSLGLDVYVLDWGYQGREDDHHSLHDYINFLNEATLALKERTGLEKIPIIGYCWGGLLSLIYTTLYKQNVESLVLIAAPVNFNKDNSLITTWVKAVDADRIIDEFGHIDGNMLDYAFMMRNPHRNLVDKYLKLFKSINDLRFMENFFEVERWLYNTPPIPGKMYRQIVNDLYKNNLLVENKLKVGDKIVNLKEVDIPLFVAVSEKDDLVSPESTLAIKDCVSSKDISEIRISGGHVGLIISKSSHEKLWPKITKWILEKNIKKSVKSKKDNEKSILTA
ncbi:MAG: alpha/beta fold hydrolase [Thaumarchaeota archaeon]|nr:alpha/beta fold hydrolase [Nitrososphaerota archaeon]